MEKLYKVVYETVPGNKVLAIVDGGSTVASSNPNMLEDDNLNCTQVIAAYSMYEDYEKHAGVLEPTKVNVRSQIESATTIAALRMAVLRWYDEEVM